MSARAGVDLTADGQMRLDAIVGRTGEGSA
jgi:hypothetical protein